MVRVTWPALSQRPLRLSSLSSFVPSDTHFTPGDSPSFHISFKLIMTSTKLHQVPEIIYRVGWFLPKELENLVDVRPARRKDVIACMRVNRLWHRTLTPLLWMVFDSNFAASRKIPSSVILKYSCHFRYCAIYDLSIPGLHSTCLRELHLLSLAPMGIICLTRSNPRLETLSLSVKDESAVVSLSLILEPLTQLKKLTLNDGKHATLDQLLQSTCHLTNLKCLELYGFTNFQAANTPWPTLGISKLTLHGEWHLNPGFAQLVRFCPRIESLKLAEINSREFRFPSLTLSRNLRECCRKLHSIRMSGAYPQLQLSEQDHLNLFSSTCHLAHYNLPVNNFNLTFCDALLKHRSTLVSVHIVCHQASEDQFRYACRILASCPHLHSFKIAPIVPSLLLEERLALFETPWKCPNLREFGYLGITPDYMLKDLKERLLNAFLELGDQKETFWRSRNHTSPSTASSGFYVPVEVNVAGPHHSISPWTRVLARCPDPGRNFYETLDREGWLASTKAGLVTLDDVERRSCRMERIVQSMIFERILDLPRMRVVNMGEVIFYKKSYFVSL